LIRTLTYADNAPGAGRFDAYFATDAFSVGADGAGFTWAEDGRMLTQLTHPDAATEFEAATVADAMTTGVICCQPHTSLRAIARLMADHRVHAVFVFNRGDEADESPELWGLVSDLDLAAAAWGGVEGRCAADSAVAPLVTVRSDDRLQHAAQLMAEQGVSHLAVIDASTRRPAGVVSTLDVARIVALD
jgi:CBS domain-containing protein